MISLTKNKLLLLVLMSMLLNLAFGAANYIATPTTPAGSACTSSQGTQFPVYATVDAATKDSDKCIKAENQVRDCYRYKTDGTCWCNSADSFNPIQIKVANGIGYGCVPIAQRIFNSICTYLSAGKYLCQCSDTQFKYPINMDISDSTNNALKIQKGCAPQQVPNCKLWRTLDATPTENKQTVYTDNDFFKVKCYTCQTGATIFTTTNPTGFIYDYTDDGGVGCPSDGTYDVNTCTSMSFNSKYICECDSKNLAVFVTSPSQKIEQGCIAASGEGYDANCELYTYSSTPANIICNKCSSGYNFLKISTDAAEASICTNGAVPRGCTSFFSSSALSATTAPDCYGCKADFDYVPSDTSVSIYIGSAVSTTFTTTGFCVPKGRFIIQTSLCSKYTAPSLTGDKITDLYLQCAASSCVSTANSNAPPCYDGNAKNVIGTNTPCTAGQLAALKTGSTDQQCLSSGIIDNCATYTDVSSNAGQGCDKCNAGYELVDTQFSAGSTTDATKKICRPTSMSDPNCLIYDNDDWTCFKCKNNLFYDKDARRCNVATDASAGCDAALSIGGKPVCLSCKLGFTLLIQTGTNPVCVSSVANCATFIVSGCTQCIKNYQLVGQNCVKLPENCVQVNLKGQCVQCASGFAVNPVGNCIKAFVTNTCPAGQAPSSITGLCAPVQIPITDCVKYTVDSRCQQCADNRKLSADGFFCNYDRYLNAKPCPANTSKIIYRRDPSNPLGDCVAVDVQCANARDDGYCISCKDGEYAHSDGKCYKLTFIGQN